MTTSAAPADPLYQPTDADIIEELLRRVQAAAPIDVNQLIKENVILTLQVRDLLQQVASYQDAVSGPAIQTAEPTGTGVELPTAGEPPSPPVVS